MGDLEEQLVAVNPVVRPLLEGQQLLGVQVPLVIGRRVPREQRPGVVLPFADRLLGLVSRHARSILRRVGDLFADAAQELQAANAPLPARLRPRTLDELVGQEHVLGQGSALRLAIAGTGSRP